MSSTPIAPLAWRRAAPGWYLAISADYEVVRVHLDDGPWWIIRYPDGSTGDPFPTLAAAKAAVEIDRTPAPRPGLDAAIAATVAAPFVGDPDHVPGSIPVMAGA